MATDFDWIKFYSEFADKLLRYRNDRKPLIDTIHGIHRDLSLSTMTDKFEDGSTGPIQDICPFTVMSEFNRHLKDQNRINTQIELARLLHVDASQPKRWPGIPVLHNQNRWFYSYAHARNPNHIDELWNLFAGALTYADNKSRRSQFVKSFNTVITRGTTIGKLTTGLFWIRPYRFLPLDSTTKQYLKDRLQISNPNDGEEYLTLTEEIRTTLNAKTDIDSFPKLSHSAYEYYSTKKEKDNSNSPKSEDHEVSYHGSSSYSVKNIINDGCFVEESELNDMLNILKHKKNLIIDGPPGTGKTYLAKRLAFALIGHVSYSEVKVIQFHPNFSYEDFVRGWRPGIENGSGGLVLIDGPLLKMIKNAKNEPKRTFVMVIEEINRGNPANVFGEMLTLLEADKRDPKEALTLSYEQKGDEQVYIPQNLYIIGTMNVADRSIAMVDMALRRRFGFVSLYPVFDKVWSNWVNGNSGIDISDLDKIGAAMRSLNERIAKDSRLGQNFKIGHSFVTPKIQIPDVKAWFKRVVKYEIGPLLKEYWFEDVETAQKEEDELLSVLT